MEKVVKYSHLDSVGTTIRGWAVDFSQKFPCCPLDLYINGVKKLTFITGSSDRGDVGSYLKSTGIDHDTLDKSYGFEVQIEHLLVPGENTVQVRFNTDGTTLSNGEASFCYEPDVIDAFEADDGFLIQIDKKYNLFEYLAGVHPLNEIEIEQGCKNIIVANHLLAANRIKFDVSICPERLCFIADKAPKKVHISETRRARQIQKISESLHAPLNYDFDLISDLGADHVARRTDTHLTPQACNMLAVQILNRLFMEDNQNDTASSITWAHQSNSGDLGHFTRPRLYEKLLVAESPSNITEIFDTKQDRLVWDLVGHASAFINPTAQYESLLVFGSSSSALISDFIKSKFRLTVNVWANGIDMDFILKIKPTAVIIILTEKTLSGSVISDNIRILPEAKMKIEAAIAMIRMRDEHSALTQLSG